MNYIGSKARLIPFLLQTIRSVVGKDLSQKAVCDLFSGSGAVGRALKSEVGFMISNDIEYYSYVLNKNILQTQAIENTDFYTQKLNHIMPIEGLIYQHYSFKSGRAYFSDHNSQKIDALRQAIEAYKSDENLYYFLLASLLESADKVANTASVYSAFLKTHKPLARKELVFEALHVSPDMKPHQVFCEDANVLIETIKGDILYLDPPYNHRQYGANYHLLNTIALYDTFEPRGKTGVRDYTSSPYCKKTKALEALEEIIKKAQFDYIFLSYNNEGLMAEHEIKNIMQKYGRYDLATTSHQRFKADKIHQENHLASSTLEYLHILEKF